MLGIDFGSIVTIAALIAASFLISHLITQHTLQQARESSREQLEIRMAGLTHAIAELERQVAELTRIADAASSSAVLAPSATPKPAHGSVATNGAAASSADPSQELSPEILVMIAAAVTAFLGKPVRIRSAKMLQSPYEIVNPWAQQGRVIVQASHNLQIRHR